MRKLRHSADRLIELEPGEDLVVKRGPLVFLACLSALENLGRV